MRSALLTAVSLLALTTEGHAYTRLILNPGNTTRQYKLLRFTNATDACNFYGAATSHCIFAKEYFAGYKGSTLATIEFDRFTIWSARAHLYGGGAVAQTPPAQLTTALNVGTSLNVPLNGVTLTTCFGTNPGCTNLTGTTYDQIASEIEGALNASPVSLGAITGTVTPISLDLNVTLRARGGAQVNSTTKPLYMGSYVCDRSRPCLIHSPDQINQFETQMAWMGGTKNGAGWYSFYNEARHLAHDPETINAVASYGILTITSYNNGSLPAAPMRITSANLPASSYLWECIAKCGQIGAQWIVNNAATISEPETITLASVQVSVLWNGRTNGPLSWGYFDIQQVGSANPNIVNTIDYATGSASDILGLSEGQPGYPGVLYSTSYVASPGAVVVSIDQWPNTFRSTVDSIFTSCEIGFSGVGFSNFLTPLTSIIQTWATQQQPPVRCPAAWVTIPPSTPSLVACINHEPSCPKQ